MAIVMNTILCLGFLIASPIPLLALPELDYQKRGAYSEGVKPKLVSGFDIEVISVMVDYKEPAERLPAQLRVKFFLKSRVEVNLTVREQDYRLFYVLGEVNLPENWRMGWRNEFPWSTETVLRKLDPKLNIYELGVLVRLESKGPAQIERMAPAILYHSQPPDKINGYLFTLKTGSDARLTCSVYREGDKTPLITQSFRKILGGRPFTVPWDAQVAEEGAYSFKCEGFFLENNQHFEQTVRFYHKPTIE